MISVVSVKTEITECRRKYQAAVVAELLLAYPCVMHRISPAIFVLVVLSGCAVTPSHNIPVRPEYIEAGVQIGDTLEVTMLDGEERTIEVLGVRTDAIEAADGDIAIADIRSIAKRSWELPGHPCGANEPVGCSIPEVVLLLSDEYNEQADKFHPACVIHDFCYRHGYVTYGVTREQCDADFLADMKKSCGGFRGLDILDLKQYSICQIAADQTHGVVRLKGKPHFRTNTSSYCEYRPDTP